MARTHQSKKTSSRRSEEGKICGRNACKELFRLRPNDIIRVYLLESELRRFSDLLKWCAANKRAYHIVGLEELERVSASSHHEGICVLAKRSPKKPLSTILAELQKSKEKKCFLLLDGTSNPHNIGSILRTAAHFGVAGILCKQGNLPNVSSSLARVAQGGAEHVPMWESMNLKKDLHTLKNAGFRIIGTDSTAKQSIFEQKLFPRTIFVLGAENDGITSSVRELCDSFVSIPGSGLVESLNVSVASGILLAEYFRQNNT